MNSNFLNIWDLNTTWSILSSINEGDKLSISGNQVLIEKNTILLGLKRTYYGDKRGDVYKLIDILLEYTIYHFKNNNHKKEKVQSFKTNIIAGLTGLMNLRGTYGYDSRFLASFNSKLEKISQLKVYFEVNIGENDYEENEFENEWRNQDIENYKDFVSLIKKIFTSPCYADINNESTKSQYIRSKSEISSDINVKSSPTLSNYLAGDS
jgi:hypothetical protein